MSIDDRDFLWYDEQKIVEEDADDTGIYRRLQFLSK